MDDLDLERFRRLTVRPDPAPYRGPGSAGFVGVVATGATAGNYMTVTPVTVTGAETEGAAGTLTSGSGTIPVFNVGPGTAVAGDYLVCRFVDYRWAAARKGVSEPAPCVNVLSCTATTCGISGGGTTVLFTATRAGFTTRTASTTTGVTSLSLAPGNWSVKAEVTGAGAARFNSVTRSSVTISSGCTFTGVSFAIPIATGYHCFSGCAIPLPSVLNFTTPIGAVALTYSGTIGPWVGTITRTIDGLFEAAGPADDPCASYADATGPYTTTFQFGGSRTSPFFQANAPSAANQVVGPRFIANSCHVANSTVGANTTVSNSVVCPTSFAFSGTMDITGWDDPLTGSPLAPSGARWGGAVTGTE